MRKGMRQCPATIFSNAFGNARSFLSGWFLLKELLTKFGTLCRINPEKPAPSAALESRIYLGVIAA
jgi:hypothetical protein